MANNFLKAKPIYLDMKTINTFAEKIAKKLNYNPGDNLNNVVENLGGKIHYLDMDKWFNTEDGSIEVYGEKKFNIYVSNFFGPFRTRFTVAHELGHYFLHSLAGKHKIKVARFGKGRLETEANWFAAGFLMPKDAFLIHKATYNDVGYLAGTFGVSSSAAEYRIKNLGKL